MNLQQQHADLNFKIFTTNDLIQQLNRNVFKIFTIVVKTFHICIFCDVAFSKM